MLDGKYKAHLNLFWNRIGRVLAKTGMTPNMVTLTGLALTVLACVYVLIFRNYFWFGIFLAVSFLFDYLDGAVARVTDSASRYGSYLDAVVDRYQEIMVLMCIGHLTQYWAISFLVISGALLVSYNKARAAMDVPVSNHRWPDLMERTERLFILCTALILQGLFPRLPVLKLSLAVLALLVHLTAIQRFLRAREILRQADKAHR